MIAEYTDDPAPPTAGTEYVMADHLGSTRAVLDTATNTLSCHDYLPFGEELTAGRESVGCYNNPDSVKQKFTGKERDAETGLDYFLARQYSGAMSRFLQPDEFKGGPVDVFGGTPTPPDPLPYADILNPQSLNKYGYTYNNPLRYVDPDGHDIVDYTCNCSPVEAVTDGHPIRDTLFLGAYTGAALFAPGLAQNMLFRFAPLATSAGVALIKARDAAVNTIQEVRGVTQSDVTVSRANRALNALKDHATDSDIKGVIREAAGVLKGKHAGEVETTVNSLSNLRKSLEGALKLPSLTDQTRAAYARSIQTIDTFIKKAKPLIDKAKDLNK